MEFLLLVLLGIAGIVLHVGNKFRDAISKEPKQDRKFREHFVAVWDKFDFLENIAYGAFALIIIIVLVAVRDVLNGVGFPVTMITIFFYGYFADSTFKNLKPESLK